MKTFPDQQENLQSIQCQTKLDYYSLVIQIVQN